jgi:hypothetical protein
VPEAPVPGGGISYRILHARSLPESIAGKKHIFKREALRHRLHWATRRLGMTERKPAGMGTGDWIEALIHKAEAEGKFDNIKNAPDPMADIDEPYDPNWWAKKLIKREGLTVMPEMLALKRDIAEFRARLRHIPDESNLRGAIDELNRRVVEVNLNHSSPIAFNVALLHADDLVAEWRAVRLRSANPIL